MKLLFLFALLLLTLLLLACSPVGVRELVVHTPAGTNDVYCTFTIDSVLKCKTGTCLTKGDTVCIYCKPNEQQTCGARQTIILETPGGDCYSVSLALTETCVRCPTQTAGRLFAYK